jgi:hypothetical protein
MTRYEIDNEDAAVFAVFGLAAAATVGIANVELFGYAFTDALTHMGGTAIPVATAVSAAAFGWIWVTNEPNLDNIEDNYRYATIGTVTLIVAIPFIDPLNAFVTSNDVIALAAVLVQSFGAVAVSFYG